jgi:hypothetical protein
MGFGLVIGFIEHFHIVTASIYSAIANSHTLKFTKVRTKSFQSAISSPVLPGNEYQQCSLIPCSSSYQLATVPQITHSLTYQRNKSTPPH